MATNLPLRLAAAVRALAAKLTPEQARDALGHLLDTIKGTARPGELRLLAEAVRALPVQLAPEQAQAALGPVLDAFKGTSNPSTLETLAAAVEVLPVQLTPEQARDALGHLLDTIKDTTDPHDLGILAHTIATFAAELDGEVREKMRQITRSGLGAARDGYEALAWSRAFNSLLPSESTDEHVDAIIEVLKYPSAALQGTQDIHAGDGKPASATEHLVGKLRERFHGAGELQGGSLEDVLDWIGRNYPGVDLASPPKRPAPLAEMAAEIAASLPAPR